MSQSSSSALTPEQWEARDYRQSASELDAWAKSVGGAGEDDSTEYVAKLGLNGAGSVIVMNRAHDRVLVPPPALAALAAFALTGAPVGFSETDVRLVLNAAERLQDEAGAKALQDLGQRIQALVPPTAG